MRASLGSLGCRGERGSWPKTRPIQGWSLHWTTESSYSANEFIISEMSEFTQKSTTSKSSIFLFQFVSFGQNSRWSPIENLTSLTMLLLLWIRCIRCRGGCRGVVVRGDSVGRVHVAPVPRSHVHNLLLVALKDQGYTKVLICCISLSSWIGCSDIVQSVFRMLKPVFHPKFLLFEGWNNLYLSTKGKKSSTRNYSNNWKSYNYM